MPANPRSVVPRCRSTVAPDRRASWTVIDPTPPAAPETATTSPRFSPTDCMVAQAVVPATYREPAASHGTFAGLGTTWSPGRLTASAWLDRSSLQPITSSPTATSSTPSPTSLTTPARSLPCPDGKVAGQRSWRRPLRIDASPGLTAAATTSTTTRPGPGRGRGTSTTFSTSISP